MQRSVEGESPEGDDIPASAELYGASFLAPAGMAKTHAASGYEAALADLKLHAAQLHINYLTLDSVRELRSRTFINGRSFVCSATPAAASPAPAPAAACVPACSPGYVCVSGQCLSACNPICQTGFRCGDDRICHKTQDDDY